MKTIKENYLAIIITLTGIIICMIGLIILYHFKLETKLLGEIFKNIILTVLISITIGTYFTLLTKDSIKNEVKKTIETELDHIADFKKVGLIKIEYDAKNYDFSDIITKSKNLTIVVNDGKAWYSTYSSELNRRLKIDDFKTKFIFLDLTDDNLNEIMIRKTNHEDDKDYVRRKIENMEDKIKRNRAGNHTIEIYKHKLFNPYSVYLTDSLALITPYRISRERDSIPLFVYSNINKDCDFKCQDCVTQNRRKINEYCRLRMDVNNIIEYSQT